ncbi:MAG: ChaN family lipoprotein [Bacteroidota bacterium]
MLRRVVQPLVFVALLLLSATGLGGYEAAATSRSPFAASTVADSTYQVYTADGEPAALSDIVASLDTVDVVLLGEVHGQARIHALQDTLWQRALATDRPAALSLEMFERDVQPVLNEYLSGFISNDHFLQASRPWSTYERDYRSLVDTARAHNAPVLAANAPRRYVNRVASEGRSALDALPPHAADWLPPRPYPEASSAYRERFMAQMSGGAHGSSHAPSDITEADTTESDTTDTAMPPGHGSGLTRLLDAQMLWDATMAYTIAEHLLRQPNALVVHLTGRFHIAERTGTPEALAHYRPGTRQLVVYFDTVSDPDSFDEDAHTDKGDFVVLTAE